ncbi:Mov34/MPN/PAD-1 family protein [Nesterenkonia sp. CF4.4]|uniref:Mov34/MPN/PAD-1 family protein n=1 Tax=Nesterenkonia sp. CF4.4 TaxID=3373079 RepID=UPI003EE43060
MPAQLTTVWLGNRITAALLREANAKAPFETGGVLLGWRSSEHICVTNIVGPGPNARHDRTSFDPDSGWQAEQIAQLYADSGRRLSYLGDWHTHPGVSPDPSPLDRRTLRAISRHPPARCTQPVMVILGQSHLDEWVASSHSVVRHRLSRILHVTQLPLRTDEQLMGF